MTDTRIVPWYEMDKPLEGFATDTAGEVLVQREAIPIIFVPGVMGSRLRRAGTDGTGDGPDGLPNMRWDPDARLGFMTKHYFKADPLKRKRMLIGEHYFTPDFLEVHNANPVGDGFQGIFKDYHGALLRLRAPDWGGALRKIFLFPVYAFGYNWTDSNRSSGMKLKARITEIKEQQRAITGLCDKVILISHSMGGLVCRSASELDGARGDILGIIHGVQPAMGSPAAYWRIKAGFEGFGTTSDVLGYFGPDVTVVLGNSPGGLQLLPNAQYTTNAGEVAWLRVTHGDKVLLSLPKSDPYNEIYRVKAVPRPPEGKGASNNAYWGLVDPELLNPCDSQVPRCAEDRASNKLQYESKAWEHYLDNLAKAERFHKELGKEKHPHTFNFHGTGLNTAETTHLAVESNMFRSDPYGEVRAFRGLFRDQDGNALQAVLQKPSGDGDGTVPTSSATALNDPNKKAPGNQGFKKVEHQDAYNIREVQDYTIKAVIALAEEQYKERRKKR